MDPEEVDEKHIAGIGRDSGPSESYARIYKKSPRPTVTSTQQQQQLTKPKGGPKKSIRPPSFGQESVGRESIQSSRQPPPPDQK